MSSESGAMGILALPEGCISHILSLTSPIDVCKSMVISPGFRSPANSDTVWERFLPSDYQEIISRSITPVELSTKKDVYARLCSSPPLLLDGGTKSFALEKMTGKKCYMLGARELKISWGETPYYWSWPSHPKSRFSEVAKLESVFWLALKGKMEMKWLSPRTTYDAYFVYMLDEYAQAFENYPIKVSVSVVDSSVELEDGAPDETIHKPTTVYVHTPEPEHNGEYRPRERGDGWMEIQMGEFTVDDDNIQDVVQMRFYEVEIGNCKSGLIVQGIELRPKETN